MYTITVLPKIHKVQFDVKHKNITFCLLLAGWRRIAAILTNRWNISWTLPHKMRPNLC